MELDYHRMTEDEKHAICSWQYEGEYALYNVDPYEEDLKRGTGMASPDYVGFSFYDGDKLIGFTDLAEDRSGVMLGIGVEPTQCNKGYGREMIRLTLDIAREHFPKKQLYLEVRSWNSRAVRCYEKAGFVIEGEPFVQVTGLGEGEFYRMVYHETR